MKKENKHGNEFVNDDLVKFTYNKEDKKSLNKFRLFSIVLIIIVASIFLTCKNLKP